MMPALGGVFYLVLAALQTAGKEMCLYSGCSTTAHHTRLDWPPLQNLSGVGFTLCGKVCSLQSGAGSYNYHRLSTVCQCLGETMQTQPGRVVQELQWYHVTIQDISRDSSHGCSCHNDFRCTIEARAVLRCPPRDTSYQLRIYTGNVDVAESDAGAYINFIGTWGSRGINVRSPDGWFNRGGLDYAQIDGVYLGIPVTLDVQTTGSIANGWYLDKITVTSNLNSTTYVFNFYVWFDTDPGYTTRHVRQLTCINC